MARKIPGEFVPLDLDMPRDIKIRKAGPDAELLYIRGLIYLKSAKYDGFVPDFDAAPCPSDTASTTRRGRPMRNQARNGTMGAQIKTGPAGNWTLTAKTV